MTLALEERGAEPVDEVVLERHGCRVGRLCALGLDEEPVVQVHAEVLRGVRSGDYDVAVEARHHLRLAVHRGDRRGDLGDLAIHGAQHLVAVRGERDALRQEYLRALGVYLVTAGGRGDDREERVVQLSPVVGVVDRLREDAVLDHLARHAVHGPVGARVYAVEDLLHHVAREAYRIHRRLLAVVHLEVPVSDVALHEPVDVGGGHDYRELRLVDDRAVLEPRAGGNRDETRSVLEPAPAGEVVVEYTCTYLVDSYNDVLPALAYYVLGRITCQCTLPEHNYIRISPLRLMQVGISDVFIIGDLCVFPYTVRAHNRFSSRKFLCMYPTVPFRFPTVRSKMVASPFQTGSQIVSRAPLDS